MYTVTAHAIPDTFTATHRCWTMREAMSWMRQYPSHVAYSVTIRRFGAFVAQRITSN